MLSKKAIKQNATLLQVAVMQNNINEVRRLIPLSDPSFDNSIALQQAATLGHVQCVELLIPVSTFDNSHVALRDAAMNGYLDCVKLLIEVMDPNDNSVLEFSAVYGHHNCVNFIVSTGLCSPNIINEAFISALENQEFECAALLFDGADKPQALQHLHNYNLDGVYDFPIDWLNDRINIIAQKKNLLTAVENIAPHIDGLRKM